MRMMLTVCFGDCDDSDDTDEDGGEYDDDEMMTVFVMFL